MSQCFMLRSMLVGNPSLCRHGVREAPGSRGAMRTLPTPRGSQLYLHQTGRLATPPSSSTPRCHKSPPRWPLAAPATLNMLTLQACVKPPACMYLFCRRATCPTGALLAGACGRASRMSRGRRKGLTQKEGELCVRVEEAAGCRMARIGEGQRRAGKERKKKKERRIAEGAQAKALLTGGASASAQAAEAPRCSSRFSTDRAATS